METIGMYKKGIASLMLAIVGIYVSFSSVVFSIRVFYEVILFIFSLLFLVLAVALGVVACRRKGKFYMNFYGALGMIVGAYGLLVILIILLLWG